MSGGFIGDRIRMLRQYYRVSMREFAAETGIGNGNSQNVYMREAGLTAVKSACVDKILKRYPHVSRRWLELGAGEMIKIRTPKSDLKIPEQIDWAKLLTLLRREGYFYREIGESIDTHENTIRNFSNGVKPPFETGARLMNLAFQEGIDVHDMIDAGVVVQ